MALRLAMGLAMAASSWSIEKVDLLGGYLAARSPSEISSGIALTAAVLFGRAALESGDRKKKAIFGASTLASALVHRGLSKLEQDEASLGAIGALREPISSKLSAPKAWAIASGLSAAGTVLATTKIGKTTATASTLLCGTMSVLVCGAEAIEGGVNMLNNSLALNYMEEN